MIYNIQDKIPFRKLILFAIQMMLSCFTATVLIANICGVSVSGALVGAGLATIIYLITTKFQSPMFISNSGAFVAPVLIALAAGGYTAVFIGGVVSFIIYTLFGIIFTKVPVEKIYKVFPQSLIGAITAVIGITLMGFISTYLQIDGVSNIWGVIIALITMVSIAIINHFASGIFSILPFLIGTFIGYAVAVILTLTGVYPIVDFSIFNGVKLFIMPDFAFTHFSGVQLATVFPVVIIYIAYTISAMMEALSDTAALGGIIGVDLYKTPGIGRIFIAEGCSNLASSFFGGLGACSYGESVGCIGFSKVASPMVTLVAAIILTALGFIGPVQAFINSIPSCVFAGNAIILYGFIACSGIKMLQKVDLNNSKNLIITSAVLSIGISGIAIGGTNFALSGTALALIVGIILNFILKEKNTNG